MNRAPGLELARPLRVSSDQGQDRAEVGAVSWGRDLVVVDVTWGTGARECPNNCSNVTLRCPLDQLVPGQEGTKIIKITKNTYQR